MSAEKDFLLELAWFRAAAARQDHDQYAPGGRPHGR